MDTKRELLKTHFGYSDFRQGQEEIPTPCCMEWTFLELCRQAQEYIIDNIQNIAIWQAEEK